MNIVLTGFMGTGKTVTGKMLAKELGFGYLDTDRMIEERTGLSIPEIFERHGEDYFRSVEKEVVDQVARKDRVVIASGGGAVLDPGNFRRLSENGLLVALLASPEEIEKRTAKSTRRPLLAQGTDRKETIRQLLKKRLPAYQKARIHVDTDGKTPAEVLQQLLTMLREEYPGLGERA